jgi:NCAIR mutase (PurE)-related protein
LIKAILKQFRENKLSLSQAEKLLKLNSISELSNIAKLDSGRFVRRGFPEVVLAEGKSLTQLRKIVIDALKRQAPIIISRAGKEKVELVRRAVPIGWHTKVADQSGCIAIVPKGYRAPKVKARIGIVTAGTSDFRVAEEIITCLEAVGCEYKFNADVGIAAIRRTLEIPKWIVNERIRVVIVVAGMDGALPSVLAGVTDVPIIAVPTSTGYGLGGQGVGALITMLQSCAGGVAVINIDNGIGAALFATLVARQIDRGP